MSDFWRGYWLGVLVATVGGAIVKTLIFGGV